MPYAQGGCRKDIATGARFFVLFGQVLSLGEGLGLACNSGLKVTHLKKASKMNREGSRLALRAFLVLETVIMREGKREHMRKKKAESRAKLDTMRRVTSIDPAALQAHQAEFCAWCRDNAVEFIVGYSVDTGRMSETLYAPDLANAEALRASHWPERLKPAPK